MFSNKFNLRKVATIACLAGNEEAVIAVESKCHLSNGVSPKDHTSRGNFLRMSVLFCAVFCAVFVAQAQRFLIGGKLEDGSPTVITINLKDMSLRVLLDVADYIEVDIEKINVVDVGEKGRDRKSVV